MEELTNDNMNYIVSEKYIKKMHLLDDFCSLNNIAENKEGNSLLHRDDTVRYKQMPVHMMYKYEALIISEDGYRAYTFNIEYCTDTPSEGIYYGAFGIVLRGTINEHKESFDREWAVIRPIAAQVLGNTFNNSYFNMLFRQTDNVNDKTYWPFWVSLGEDIVEVALRAVKIIRRIYETYFANKIDEYNPIPRKGTVKKPYFPCTEKAFENISENGKADNIKDEKLRFFKWCQKEHQFSRKDLYEMAWIINELPTRFVFLVETYLSELMKRKIYKTKIHTLESYRQRPAQSRRFTCRRGKSENPYQPNMWYVEKPRKQEKIHENEQYAQTKLKNYFT